MLRTVEETAIQLGVSKTTIYNKLKLKDFKSRIVKNKENPWLMMIYLSWFKKV